MPECSVVSHIFVIVKPDYYAYYPDIVALIKRLNYRIHQLEAKKLDLEKARSLIKHLMVLKLPT